MELRRPDDICLTSRRARPASGGQLRLIVRTRATNMLISEAAGVRTALIYLPEERPTEAIYTPECRSLHHTPQNPSFWQLVSKVCELLAFCCSFLSFCALFRIPAILFNLFLFNFFKIVRMLVSFGMFVFMWSLCLPY
jgi:hypothetical protein